jgi:hypothetical protein
MLRPGNAGSNTAVDHVTVLAAAIAQLPEDWRAGHQSGDGPGQAALSASTSTTASATPSSWSRKRTGNPLSSPAASAATAPKSQSSPT